MKSYNQDSKSYRRMHRIKRFVSYQSISAVENNEMKNRASISILLSLDECWLRRGKLNQDKNLEECYIELDNYYLDEASGIE